MLRWTLLFLTACAVAPTDPFRDAEAALAAGDLPTALAAFDTVPVAHPRYPEARAAAIGVERRLRRSHEELLAALTLRAEWRDPEAVATMERVLVMWPDMPGIHRLLVATRGRADLLALRSPRVVAPSSDPSRPAAAAVPPAVASAPATKSVALAPAPSVAEVRDAGSVSAPVAEVDAEQVTAALAEVERLLHGGKLADGIARLRALAGEYNRDLRVRDRLVRVLHQRALLSYGRGGLTAAVADWQEVLALDTGHGMARSMLASAQAELTAAAPR
ncbi:MAG: hypothetical protein RL398_72 [Planctomycetota bacterium]